MIAAALRSAAVAALVLTALGAQVSANESVNNSQQAVIGQMTETAATAPAAPEATREPSLTPTAARLDPKAAPVGVGRASGPKIAALPPSLAVQRYSAPLILGIGY
jgi:hypothetical protein